MLLIPFKGSEKFVHALTQAVKQDNEQDLATQVSQAMEQLINDPEVELPDCVFDPVDDHYARRELYRCDDTGFSVIAMTWGPNQATPVHDHSGMWCVEGVWHGELEITQYEPMEQDDTRIRFRAEAPVSAKPGSTGSLIPPHEYHTIANKSPTDTAISVHVYRGVMEQCQTYVDTGDNGWHIKNACNLGLDEA